MKSLKNPKPPSSTDAVRAVFASGAEITDAELVAHVVADYPDMHRGQTIPARIRLERRGEVELAGKNEQGRNVWRRTPPERRDAAKEAGERRRKSPVEKLQHLKPEARAQIVAALLDDGRVNQLLRDQTERSRAMRRARARAHETHAETEAERRERKRALQQAERDKSRYLSFLKVHDGLRDSIGVLFDIRRFMREELKRHERGEQPKIPPDRWPNVKTNLHEVIHVAGALWHDLTTVLEVPPEHCPLCGERIARDPRALDEGYIEAYAEELAADPLVGSNGGA